MSSISFHSIFMYFRRNNATTVTMNSDVPSVPITTLAGIHSLTDRKSNRNVRFKTFHL